MSRATPKDDGRTDVPVAPLVERLQSADEMVDEASRESFPASDPPSWTLGIRRPASKPKPIGA